jgi:Zn-dependent protease with chaperone function
MESAVPVLVPPLAAAIIAVAAAVLAAVAVRPLLRAAESPTLPERLLRWAGHHRVVAVLAYVPLLLSGRSAVWAVPLAWLGLQITSHRVRRTIFGDRWSLGGQVWWNARSLLAIQAWWWSMMFAPAVLLYTDAPPAIVVATGVGLLAWLYFYNDALAALLGARPVDAPALRDAFEPILAKATVRRPRLLQAGPRGARLINAFALGSVRGDVVLFLDGLLEELAPVESAAVLAHEIGHLEDFATRRWTVYGLAPVLVVGGMLVTLVVGRLGWDDWLGLVWLVVVCCAVLSRVVRSQQRETASDRRAVEQCGDGEALIRALVAIHDGARVPRRFQPEFAQRATHPSLARRIQAIRAIGGVAAPAIEPRAFAGDGVPRAVVFEAGRIVFVMLGDDERPDLADLAGMVQRARHLEVLPYGELSSLHVDPKRDGGATLVSVDRRGETRRLPIADADVAAVQAMLDAADAHLGPAVPAQRLPHITGRVAAVTALLAALPLFAWSVVATALVTLVRPTTPLLGGLAAALVITAALQARHPSTPWQVAAIVLIGGLAAAVAVRQHRIDRRHDAPFRWDGFLLVGFLVVAASAIVPSWLIVALGHDDLGQLHVAARAFVGGAAGWAALGGVSLAVPRRLARLTAIAAFGLAATVAAIGSNTFRDRVVPDPLVSSSPAVVVQDLAMNENGRLSASSGHWQISLAPDAQHVVLGRDGSADEGTARFVVAGFDGWQRSIDADDVRFVDAGTLLVSRWDERTLRLTAEPIREAAPRWTLDVPDAPAGGNLDVDAAGRWRIEPAGDDEPHQKPERLEGRIGNRAFSRLPLAAPDRAAEIPPQRGVSASGAAIAVRREFSGTFHRLGWLLPDLAWRSVLERVDGAAPGVLARSRLALDCWGPSLTSATATCLARTGDDTFVWEVAADAGAPRPIATMTGRVVSRGADDRAVLVWHERDLLMLWRGTHHALRIARDRRCPCAHDGAYAAGHVVTLTRRGDRDVVVRYPFTPPR